MRRETEQNEASVCYRQQVSQEDHQLEEPVEAVAQHGEQALQLRQQGEGHQRPQDSVGQDLLLEEIRKLRQYVEGSEGRIRKQLELDQRQQIDHWAVRQADTIRRELEIERERSREESQGHKKEVRRLQLEMERMRLFRANEAALLRGTIRNNEYCPRDASPEAPRTHNHHDESVRGRQEEQWKDPFQPQEQQQVMDDAARLFPSLFEVNAPSGFQELPRSRGGIRGTREQASRTSHSLPRDTDQSLGAVGDPGRVSHQGQHPPVQSTATRQEMEQNPVMQRYLRYFPNYGQRQFENPYVAALQDESDEYYRTSFPYPFNAPPPADAPLITDCKKIEGLVPKFSGKESEFMDLYVHSEHSQSQMLSRLESHHPIQSNGRKGRTPGQHQRGCWSNGSRLRSHNHPFGAHLHAPSGPNCRQNQSSCGDPLRQARRHQRDPKMASETRTAVRHGGESWQTGRHSDDAAI